MCRLLRMGRLFAGARRCARHRMMPIADPTLCRRMMPIAPPPLPQNREIAELQAAMKEIQKECDRIRNRQAITKVK